MVILTKSEVFESFLRVPERSDGHLTHCNDLGWEDGLEGVIAKVRVLGDPR